MRGSFRLHLALLLVGAAVVLWGTSVDWITWTERTPGLPTLPDGAAGHELNGAMRAFAVVALAGVPALFALRRGGVRRVLAALLGLVSGLGVLLGATDAMAYRRRPVLRELGCTGCFQGRDGPQLGPTLVVLGALLLLVAGIVAARWGGSWRAGLGSSYEAPGAPAPEPVTDKGVWDALDRGEDPTA